MTSLLPPLNPLRVTSRARVAGCRALQLRPNDFARKAAHVHLYSRRPEDFPEGTAAWLRQCAPEYDVRVERCLIWIFLRRTPPTLVDVRPMPGRLARASRENR
jgi:hypothetical protein